jgi:hypothetical protein
MAGAIQHPLRKMSDRELTGVAYSMKYKSESIFKPEVWLRRWFEDFRNQDRSCNIMLLDPQSAYQVKATSLTSVVYGCS